MKRFARQAWAWLVLLSFGPAMGAAPVDVVKIDLEPLIRAASASPNQFAVPIPHPVSTSTAGTWSEAKGRATWHYAVQVPTAISLSFHATRISLPASATLTVRSAGGVMTSYRANQLRRGELWSRISIGDELDFTIDVAATDRKQTLLEIASFQAGYRSLGGSVKDHPIYRRMKTQSAAINAVSSSSCVQNYQCNVTSGNTAPGQATVGLVIGGLYQCTGILVNDVPGDNTPYVLTARHCETGKLGGGNPGAAASITVYWNAVSACGQALGTLYDPGIATQTGAATIVEQQDTWLIRLDESPNGQGVQFAGFDASGGAVQGGYSIHHALGSDKQFTAWSGQAAPVQQSGVLGVSYLSNFLEVVNQLGVIGPGASGGGLFDQNNRLVGTLSLGRTSADPSGYESCPASNPPSPNGSNGSADFTSLAAVWNSTADTTSSTGSVTLKSVLDPGNTGATVAPSAPAATISFSASTYSLPVGGTVQLTWSVPGATQCTASGGAAGDGWGGPVSGSSTQQVTESVASIVIYTLSCQLSGGRSVKSSVTITWGSPNPTLTFTSQPGAWTTRPATLTWTSNLAPCTITGGNLSTANLPSSGSTTATQDTPGDVLYQITCGPPGHSITGGTNVTFVTPSMSFSANGTDRILGEEFWLQWQSFADTCTPSGGAPNDGWTTTAFPQPWWTPPRFSPHVTTLGTYTYTLTCSSGPISMSKDIVVTFENNAPYVTASIDRTSVVYANDTSDYFTLSWNSNLSQCVPQSNPMIGGWISEGEAQDSAKVNPAPGTYVFSVQCNGYSRLVSATSPPITVTVLPPPAPTVTLSISPSTVAIGQVITVTWASTGTLNCKGPQGPSGAWYPSSLSGSVGVIGNTPGQFTVSIDCQSIWSGWPDATAQTTVTVSAAQPTVSLSASSTKLTVGQTLALTWSATNASSCTASGGAGAAGSGWSGSLATSGSESETLNATGTFTYTLTCINGTQSAQAQTTVTVAAASSTGGSSGSSGGSGGGGGGGMDLFSLGLLSAVYALRAALSARRPTASG